MSNRMLITLLAGTVLLFHTTHSQPQQPLELTLQLPFAGQMPAQIDEWRRNEALIRLLVRNNSKETISDFWIRTELLRDGQRIASADGPAQPRFTIGPGQTLSLSWREVVSEQALQYDQRLREQIITTGLLPEGQYQLCMVAISQLRPISPQQCANFPIQLPDPPQLISPANSAQLNTPMPLFQWTSTTPAYPGVLYRLVVKPMYRGQTPAQAMQANPVRIQHDLSTTSYQTQVHEQLGPDATDPNYAGHVWQVQALRNGRPFGRNNGLSQIWMFTVPPIAVDPIKDTCIVFNVAYPADLAQGELVLQRKVRPGKPVCVKIRFHAPETLAVALGEPVTLYPILGGHMSYKPPKGVDTSEKRFCTGCGYSGGFFVYSLPQDTSAGQHLQESPDHDFPIL